MKFDIILADPPWRFEAWDEDTGNGRSAESHYSTMSVEDICALQIPAAHHSILFIWAVWPMLPDALTVIESWGFEYKTIGWTWVKANPLGMGFFTGMGYYTRANTEPCLLATRGKTLPVARHDIQALIYSPVRNHSQKPDEQYPKIEKLYPGRNYLEMFARQKGRPGWSYWGNEIESDIEIGMEIKG